MEVYSYDPNKSDDSSELTVNLSPQSTIRIDVMSPVNPQQLGQDREVPHEMHVLQDTGLIGAIDSIHSAHKAESNTSIQSNDDDSHDDDPNIVRSWLRLYAEKNLISSTQLNSLSDMSIHEISLLRNGLFHVLAQSDYAKQFHFSTLYLYDACDVLLQSLGVQAPKLALLRKSLQESSLTSSLYVETAETDPIIDHIGGNHQHEKEPEPEGIPPPNDEDERKHQFEESGTTHPKTDRLAQIDLLPYLDDINTTSDVKSISTPAIPADESIPTTKKQSIASTSAFFTPTTLFFMVYTFLCAIPAFYYAISMYYTPYFAIISWYLIVAKFCAGLIYLNIALIFLPMCHSLIGLIHSKETLRRFIPLGQLLTLHKVCGIILVVAGTVHSGMHLIGTFRILATVTCPSTAQEAEETSLAVGFDIMKYCGKSYLEWTFWSIPGLSGVFLLVLFYIIAYTSRPSFRESKFAQFITIHHLFIPIVVLMILHGMGEYVQTAHCWVYLACSFTFYLIDRLYRFVQLSCGAKKRVIVKRAKVVDYYLRVTDVPITQTTNDDRSFNIGAAFELSNDSSQHAAAQLHKNDASKNNLILKAVQLAIQEQDDLLKGKPHQHLSHLQKHYYDYLKRLDEWSALEDQGTSHSVIASTAAAAGPAPHTLGQPVNIRRQSSLLGYASRVTNTVLAFLGRESAPVIEMEHPHQSAAALAMDNPPSGRYQSPPPAPPTSLLPVPSQHQKLAVNDDQSRVSSHPNNPIQPAIQNHLTIPTFDSKTMESFVLLELVVPKDYIYKSGQYVQLLIPDISLISHPFTIASSPYDLDLAVVQEGASVHTHREASFGLASALPAASRAQSTTNQAPAHGIHGMVIHQYADVENILVVMIKIHGEWTQKLRQLIYLSLPDEPSRQSPHEENKLSSSKGPQPWTGHTSASHTTPWTSGLASSLDVFLSQPFAAPATQIQSLVKRAQRGQTCPLFVNQVLLHEQPRPGQTADGNFNPRHDTQENADGTARSSVSLTQQRQHQQQQQEKSAHTRIMMVAGGIGITPFIASLRFIGQSLRIINAYTQRWQHTNDETLNFQLNTRDSRSSTTSVLSGTDLQEKNDDDFYHGTFPSRLLSLLQRQEKIGHDPHHINHTLADILPGSSTPRQVLLSLMYPGRFQVTSSSTMFLLKHLHPLLYVPYNYSNLDIKPFAWWVLQAQYPQLALKQYRSATNGQSRDSAQTHGQDRWGSMISFHQNIDDHHQFQQLNQIEDTLKPHQTPYRHSDAILDPCRSYHSNALPSTTTATSPSPDDEHCEQGTQTHAFALSHHDVDRMGLVAHNASGHGLNYDIISKSISLSRNSIQNRENSTTASISETQINEAENSHDHDRVVLDISQHQLSGLVMHYTASRPSISSRFLSSLSRLSQPDGLTMSGRMDSANPIHHARTNSSTGHIDEDISLLISTLVRRMSSRRSLSKYITNNGFPHYADSSIDLPLSIHKSNSTQNSHLQIYSKYIKTSEIYLPSVADVLLSHNDVDHDRHSASPSKCRSTSPTRMSSFPSFMGQSEDSEHALQFVDKMVSVIGNELRTSHHLVSPGTLSPSSSEGSPYYGNVNTVLYDEIPRITVLTSLVSPTSDRFLSDVSLSTIASTHLHEMTPSSHIMDPSNQVRTSWGSDHAHNRYTVAFDSLETRQHRRSSTQSLHYSHRSNVSCSMPLDSDIQHGYYGMRDSNGSGHSSFNSNDTTLTYIPPREGFSLSLSRTSRSSIQDNHQNDLTDGDKLVPIYGYPSLDLLSLQHARTSSSLESIDDEIHSVVARNTAALSNTIISSNQHSRGGDHQASSAPEPGMRKKTKYVILPQMVLYTNGITSPEKPHNQVENQHLIANSTASKHEAQTRTHNDVVSMTPTSAHTPSPVQIVQSLFPYITSTSYQHELIRQYQMQLLAWKQSLTNSRLQKRLFRTLTTIRYPRYVPVIPIPFQFDTNLFMLSSYTNSFAQKQGHPHQSGTIQRNDHNLQPLELYWSLRNFHQATLAHGLLNDFILASDLSTSLNMKFHHHLSNVGQLSSLNTTASDASVLQRYDEAVEMLFHTHGIIDDIDDQPRDEMDDQPRDEMAPNRPAVSTNQLGLSHNTVQTDGINTDHTHAHHTRGQRTSYLQFTLDKVRNSVADPHPISALQGGAAGVGRFSLSNNPTTASNEPQTTTNRTHSQLQTLPIQLSFLTNFLYPLLFRTTLYITDPQLLFLAQNPMHVLRALYPAPRKSISIQQTMAQLSIAIARQDNTTSDNPNQNNISPSYHNAHHVFKHHQLSSLAYHIRQLIHTCAHSFPFLDPSSLLLLHAQYLLGKSSYKLHKTDGTVCVPYVPPYGSWHIAFGRIDEKGLTSSMQHSHLHYLQHFPRYSSSHQYLHQDDANHSSIDIRSFACCNHQMASLVDNVCRHVTHTSHAHTKSIVTQLTTSKSSHTESNATIPGPTLSCENHTEIF